MKRFWSALIALGLLVQPAGVLAVPMDYSGGVNNEYEYQEYVFLSGEPVKFIGTYDINETTRKDQKTNTDKTTITYKFTLAPEDTDISGKLSRQITYVITSAGQDGKGQTISKTELSKYKESIKMEDAQYDLADFQFSKSNIIDNRPVSDFYSGSINGRKYYTINNTEGKAIVDISGGDEGYNNFWGNTDTQLITCVINVEWEASGDGEEDRSWEGTVKIQVSDSTTKSLTYTENEATYSSFDGGYVRVTNRGLVSEYTYDMPKIDDAGIPDDDKRKTGTKKLSSEMVSQVDRLVVPKFKDIGGYWAEADIKKLYSLDVFDETAEFFQPELYMSRAEFTKAVMRACDIRPVAADTRKTASASNKKVQETSYFSDIPTTDADYQYIKDAVSKGIITGVTKDLFKPDDPLTRAQAIVILIRALGFENKAPTPGYYTAFDDDRTIPQWAQDSVYVAREISLVTGDDYNRFNPNKVLTRAEASALLVNFLQFLENDLQKDYRENIILYN